MYLTNPNLIPNLIPNSILKLNPNLSLTYIFQLNLNLKTHYNHDLKKNIEKREDGKKKDKKDRTDKIGRRKGMRLTVMLLVEKKILPSPSS